MAILPIDLQTLYSQMDKVSKTVVQQQQHSPVTQVQQQVLYLRCCFWERRCSSRATAPPTACISFESSLQCYLFVQSPGSTILAVLDFKAECCKFVAYLVTGSPVLVCLGNLALLQKHVDHLAESLLAGTV